VTDRLRPSAAIIIPALNEEEVIGDLVAALKEEAANNDLPVTVEEIVVVDNGSSDRTAERAKAAGARVVSEPKRGYGRACLAGAKAAEHAEILIFLDGDGSDDPRDLPKLIEPLVLDRADLVMGSRILGHAEPGSLTVPQRFGNWLSARLLRLVYRVQVTDVAPFRAIRRATLLDLGMQEMTYGWPVEMLARAGQRGLRVTEVPVNWRRRAGGESKVSGDLQGSIRAGSRILATLFRTEDWPALVRRRGFRQ
jgi:glycosyltransferase involved in cell wall biosynthesis